MQSNDLECIQASVSSQQQENVQSQRLLFNQSFAYNTIDSFRTEEQRVNFGEASVKFSKFFRTQLKSKKISPQDLLENDEDIFGKYRATMYVSGQFLNLYFLPKTILIGVPIDLDEISTKIIKKYSSCAISLKKRKKNGYKSNNAISQQLQIKLHSKNWILFYRVKSISVVSGLNFLPQQYFRFDSALLLEKCLWKFYQQNYGNQYPFHETLGIILYWAYRKGVLSYLSVECFILIVIYFFTNSGNMITNILPQYSRKRAKQCSHLKQMSFITENFDTCFSEEIYKNQNFTLTEKKGFYLVKHCRYSRMKNIIPIPFPVQRQQFDQESAKIGKLINKKTKSSQIHKDPCQIFLKIIRFFQKCIRRSEKIIIDLSEDRKGLKMQQSKQFCLQIIDPIFRNNLCSQIFEGDSQKNIDYLTRQFENVIKASANIDNYERKLAKILGSNS